jgi:GAF domain-containing protein
MSEDVRGRDPLVRVHEAAQADDLAAAFDVIAHVAVEAVPGSRWASVTVVGDDGRATTAAYRGEPALRLDLAQYEVGDGPCLHAARHGEVALVVDVADETRWPGYVASAGHAGVASSLSVPIPSAAVPDGALNLYADQVRAFGADDVDVAARFAGHAAVAIANARALSQAQSLAAHLEVALQSRDVIGQAKGIMMHAERITESEAFERLSQASQRRNVKLREVAAEVARTGALEG